MSAVPPKKRMGRPIKDPKPDEKATLGMRVSPAIKTRLIAAAAANFNSISQEAEHRIRQSFEHEDMLNSIRAIINKAVAKARDAA